MPNIKPALVILAGGLGSRFGGAKQVAPFGARGRFLFEYACYDAMQAGFQKVYVITRPGMQVEISAQLQRWIHPSRFEILIQEQSRSKPWGTAHALHFLTGHWGGPFLVLNADDYYGSSICIRAKELLERGIQNAALLFELAPTLSPNGPVARGLCKVEQGFLKDVEEVLRIERIGASIQDEQGHILAPDTLISMNAWLFEASFLTHLTAHVQQFLNDNAQNETAEVYLPKVVQELIQKNQLKVSATAMPAEWFGLTYLADLALAQQKITDLEKSVYPTEFTAWI
jgi:dTDP-glucose pyrophosphorylase